MVSELFVLLLLRLALADHSYGDVSFENSCTEEVKGDFNTALSMMYSFWYSHSLALFDDILTRDPECCMVSRHYALMDDFVLPCLLAFYEHFISLLFSHSLILISRTFFLAHPFLLDPSRLTGERL